MVITFEKVNQNIIITIVASFISVSGGPKKSDILLFKDLVYTSSHNSPLRSKKAFKQF